MHFEQSRRPFFLGALLYILIMAVNAYVTFDVPLLHPLRFGQSALVVAFGVGATMESRRVDPWLVVVVAGVIVFGFVRTLSGASPWSLK